MSSVTRLSEQRRLHDLKENTVRGAILRQLILGGQDGVVNTLGILLGVATATSEARLVIITGIAAAFAESISMAAVAYTSAKAQKEYYHRQREREAFEIEKFPGIEREEVEHIYRKKGFDGKILQDIVSHITSDKQKWLDEMMLNELELTETDFDHPAKEGIVVGFSSLAGAFVPLLPFIFLPVQAAVIVSVAFSALVLFFAGAFKTKQTIGNWAKGGLELAIVGICAAIAGYVIGMLLGASGI